METKTDGKTNMVLIKIVESHLSRMKNRIRHGTPLHGTVFITVNNNNNNKTKFVSVLSLVERVHPEKIQVRMSGTAVSRTGGG